MADEKDEAWSNNGLRDDQELEPGYVDYRDDDPHITLGCHRETRRLDRLLKVYHKIIGLATANKKEAAIISELVALHDHKGTLTATWTTEEGAEGLVGYVEAAWRDENEWEVKHTDMDSPKFTYFKETE